MKMTLENTPGLNLVTGYGLDHLMINKVRHDGNLMFNANRIIPGWAPNGFDGLTEEDFAALLTFEADIVIIGTGTKLRFPQHALLRPLIEAPGGFEIMDLSAACRTYNVLATEGRIVAAAVMFDPD